MPHPSCYVFLFALLSPYPLLTCSKVYPVIPPASSYESPATSRKDLSPPAPPARARATCCALTGGCRRAGAGSGFNPVTGEELRPPPVPGKPAHSVAAVANSTRPW